MIVRKFFSYAFGLIWKPAKTIPKIVEEPNKKLMIFYAIVWNNILLLVFLGIVTAHRFLSWSIYNIKHTAEILISSMYFVIFCNVVMLVVAVLYYLYLLYLKRKLDVQPSILYSYIYLSVFILVLNVFSIIYHFIQSDSQDIILVGVLLLGATFVLASEIIATYLKKYQSYLAGYFIMFGAITFAMTVAFAMIFYG